MLERRADRWQAGLMTATLLLGLWAWRQVPADARVPIHFNVRSEVDGWASPAAGLLVLPVVGALMWGLRHLVDKLDPESDPESHDRRASALDHIFLAVAGLFAGIQLIIVAVALTDWRPVAAHFLFPLALLLLVVGRASFRLADPRDPKLAASSRALRTLRWAGPITLVLVFAVLAYQAFGAGELPPNLLLVGVGLLLMVTGNVMGKLRPNSGVGIRTRWTLANTRVWDQTHRFGGKAQVLAGAVLLALAFTPLPTLWHGPVVALVALAASGATVVKSYSLWRALPLSGRDAQDGVQDDA